MKATPRTEYEQDVIDNAVGFTCCRGHGINRTITRHETLIDAVCNAVLDGRTMIYAFDANGLQAHVQNV